MENVKEYISIIIYISIVLIIMELITPKTNLKKYVVTISSLFVILLIVSPIIDIFKNESFESVSSQIIDTLSKEYEDSKSEFNSKEISKYENKKINKRVKESLENEIKDYLTNEYKQITTQNVICTLNEDFTIDEISVSLKKKEGENQNLGDLSLVKNIISSLEEKYEIEKETFKIVVED